MSRQPRTRTVAICECNHTANSHFIFESYSTCMKPSCKCKQYHYNRTAIAGKASK